MLAPGSFAAVHFFSTLEYFSTSDLPSYFTFSSASTSLTSSLNPCVYISHSLEVLDVSTPFFMVDDIPLVVRLSLLSTCRRTFILPSLSRLLR